MRSRFDVLVNEAMARLMNRGIHPTKREVCEELGLDYDDPKDRGKVTNSIHKHKEIFDHAWNQLYVGGGAFARDYAEVSMDTNSYEEWRRRDAELYNLLRQLGVEETEIHEFWVYSILWNRFVETANREWNLHLFVAYGGQPWVADSYRYMQPNYWDYTFKQIEIAQNLGKGMVTTLARHRDLRMMLISGESVETALLATKDTLQMLTNGAPLRHRCEECARRGEAVAFRTQKELIEHYNQHHASPL